MQPIKTVAVSLSVLMALTGCAATPLGPTVQVMPAANKPFEVFQQDQDACKQYAAVQVGGQAETANERAIGATLLGAGLGAGLGAALGGGRGAGIGAAGGGVVGTAIGGGSSQHTQLSIQQQYDNAYAQCMYAKGNQIVPPPVRPMVVYPAPPVIYAPPPAVYYAPPPTVYYPPPQPTYYPPPPGAMAPPPSAPPPPPPGSGP